MEMFKKLSVSAALSTTLVSAVLISLPAQAADQWQTISPSDCRVSRLGATPILDGIAVQSADYVANASGEITNVIDV